MTEILRESRDSGNTTDIEKAREMPSEPLRMYVFFRPEGWYPVEIPPSQLQANIDLNPGTLRVEDMAGNRVWEATKQ